MALDRLLELLRRGGDRPQRVRDWSVYWSEVRRLSLGVKDRQAGNPHAPMTLAQAANLRYLFVWEDGKISRGLLERRQLESELGQVFDDAREAAYDDPDAAQVLGPNEFPDVRLHDPATERIADGETDTIAHRLERIRRRIDEEGCRTWSGSFGAGAGNARLVTSAGLDVSGEGTSVGWHVTVNGEIGDGHSARRLETDEEFSTRLDRLFETLHELERPAVSLQGGVQPVLLHPRVVDDYVIDTLLGNLEGSAVAHGEGHFRREEFGADRAVLDPRIVLAVDPLLPYRSGSYRFTTEGLPAAACTYIDRGRLVTPILTLKYAKRLGMTATPVPFGSDTIVFRGSGTLSREAALARAEGGALVLSVLGVHTQDRASGDFSLSAPQVLRIAGGRCAGKLRATLSGNLFELLSDPELQFVEFPGETLPGLLLRCRLDPSAP